MVGGSPGGILRRIGQAEIEQLLILRQQAQEVRSAAGKKQGELEAEEERLMAALKSGAQVQPGPFMLLVATVPTARSVKWRSVVEQHIGKAFAEQILAATPPGERQVLKVLQEIVTDGGRR